MIGRLHGHIVHRQPPFLLLDVNGVGYEIEAPMSTFFAISNDDQPVTLHTHLAIRDDAHVLYGFVSESDRTLFRALLKVSGVGGKMALAILSGMTSDEFRLAIQSADSAALTRLPGVGKKTAERLIIELRDRLQKLTGAMSPLTSTGGVNPATPTLNSAPLDDALSALVSLGYKLADAQRMTRGIDCQGLTTEQIIRVALQAAR